MTARLTPLRHRLAGGLILTGLILQIIGFLPGPGLSSWAGAALWLAMALMWRDIPARTRWQAGSLATIGLVLLVLAEWRHDIGFDWTLLPAGNVYVVAMLVGVSFVALIGRDQGAAAQPADGRTGATGMFQTWFGVHFLGIILNLSTIFMIGDRLARQGSLQLPQLLALNRGLSSAALWSPFFASMGVVLTLAPDMEYSQILLVGFPVAMLAGAISTLELRQNHDLRAVTGFSLSPRSLLMPVLMAGLVMLFYQVITPGLGIVSIITFLMPLTALLTNALAGLYRFRRRMLQHVQQRLPMMRGEISLFLAAGLLTLGLSTYIEAIAGSDWTLFARFGAVEASISLVAVVLSAVAGLHPIIGISVLASMLSLDAGEQTLFGFMALGAWAVGTSAGPLSGINLSLQGRYGVSGYRLMRHNLVYAGLLLLIVLLALWILAAVK